MKNYEHKIKKLLIYCAQYAKFNQLKALWNIFYNSVWGIPYT
jgi:hypothetical protein